jgi:hypothetical protein
MSGKNPIGWFEIRVSDFEKAKNFYSQIFDWEFKLSQGSKTIYWNIYTGENNVGGGFTKRELSEQRGQSIIIYIEVEDINLTLEKIKSLGGHIEQEKTLISETAGYFAIFKDLDENIMGLWSMK